MGVQRFTGVSGLWVSVEFLVEGFGLEGLEFMGF